MTTPRADGLADKFRLPPPPALIEVPASKSSTAQDPEEENSADYRASTARPSAARRARGARDGRGVAPSSAVTSLPASHDHDSARPPAPKTVARPAFVETEVSSIIRDWFEGQYGARADVVGTWKRSKSTVVELELSQELPEEQQKELPELVAAQLRAAEVRLLPTVDAETLRIEVFLKVGPTMQSRQYVAYLPIELRNTVNDLLDEGENFTNFLLTAFNEHYGRLSGVFAPSRTVEGPMPMKQSRRRRNVEDAVQVWLFLSPEQRDILDDAVVEFNAGNRSALVTKLLEMEAAARANEGA